MFYWSGVTRNLIMQNSAPVQRHGGDLGSTTWSYVVGRDGVKTIDPIVGFYLNPPRHSSCRWSTDNGRHQPNHIVISNGGVNEDAMPPRELVDWNDDTILAKAELYRQRYCMELTNMVRPNTFEDLYELFDSATLWSNGAYNLWKLVNALITLAHDQFPYVMQDWKSHIEKVVYDFFRPVTGSRLVRGEPNRNMEVLCNQQVLTEWDRVVDPLTLLQRTSFPVANLPLMNVQQHGLLRELLICEHIRLTGSQPQVPQYYNYPRPAVNAAPTFDFVDQSVQRASINNASQVGPSATASQVDTINISTQKSRSLMPLIVVGTKDADGELKTQPANMASLCKKPVTCVTVDQAHILTLPSSAGLHSIPEGSAAIKTGETMNTAETVAETGIGNLPSRAESLLTDAKMSVSKSVTKEVSPAVIPTNVGSQLESLVDSSARDIVTDKMVCNGQAQTRQVETSVAETVAKKSLAMAGADLAGAGMAIPRIVTKEASPSAESPMRDRKDSNGSTDKLFFPDAPSDKLHVGRQPSIASAPEQDTEPMLTVAEKSARIVSETPPAMQPHRDQQKYTLQSAPGVPSANDRSREISVPFLVPARNQGRQQSASKVYPMRSMPQHGRHMEPPVPHSSQMMPPFGPQNLMLQGSGPFNPSPQSMHAGPNGCISHCGPPPPSSVAMPMGPPMGPPFRDQIIPHMHQQFDLHAPPMNSPPPFLGSQDHYRPGYQPNGYAHQSQHYISPGEQDDNGYGSNGYRNTNSNGGFNIKYNGKRRDSIQSNASRKTRMGTIPGTLNSTPLQASTEFSGRRLPHVGGPDQHRGKPGLSNCKNDRGMAYEDLFHTRFAECPCARCEENSRSVFVTLRPQGKTSDGDLQHALLKHFAQFDPVSAKIKRTAHNRLNCFIEFHNDIDMARAIHWSCDPKNQAVLGILNHVHIWYPLYSKHYVPRQRYGTQDRYQPLSLHEHNRRESNPFHDQPAVDYIGSNDSYQGSGLLKQGLPSSLCNGPMAASSFPSQTGMIYQQVQPQNQPRILFNPNALQRRYLKLQSPEQLAAENEQSLVTKTPYSQDVRRGLIMSEDSWRQSQTKLPSEEVITGCDDDAVKAVDEIPTAHSVKTAKVSLPTEKESSREAASRSGSPGPDNKAQNKVQPEQLQKEQPQIKRPQHGQHRKDRSHKNKTQKDNSRTERIPTSDGKVTGKSGDKSVAGSLESFQRDIALADEPTKNVSKGGEKRVASSCVIELETTKPFGKDYVSIAEPKAADEDDKKSIASSRTITPDATTASQIEVMAHFQKSPAKSNKIARKDSANSHPKKFDKKSEQKSHPERQGDYEKTVGDLAASAESTEAERSQTDTVIGGYSKTIEQLSSAVEDVGYSMDTVIRHKPGRSAIPARWADAGLGDNSPTIIPSPTKGTQTGSEILNRIKNIKDCMSAYEEVMSSGDGNVPGHDLAPNEARASSVASASNDTSQHGCPTSVDAEASTEVQKNLKTSRKNKNKKKKKVQGGGSHLISRPNTPSDIWSRGPSPALDQPFSAAGFTNASPSQWPSPRMQDINDACTEGNTQSMSNNDKRAKVKRKRTLVASGTSDELVKGGGSQDNTEQSARPFSPLHKTETLQEKSAEKSMPISGKAANGSQTKTANQPASNNTGGSLRMPKNRSPKKSNQQSGSQTSTKSQAPKLDEPSSLHAAFEPPAKRDEDIYLERSPFAEQKSIIVQTKKAAPQQMSTEKPDSQTNSLKATGSNDRKIVVSKVALPLLQVPQFPKPTGNWASVTKSAAAHTPQANNRDECDPFAAGKDQVQLGDFIKDKNVKSPRKPKVNSEEENASSDKASPSPSPKRKSRRPNTSKTQLNAAVESFNPSASCMSSPTLTKPRLNPTAATFNLPSSPLPRLASGAAAAHGRICRDVTAVNTNENEKPVVARASVPHIGHRSVKKGHTKKPSLPGHTTGMDKRFVTPAEQVVDADKVIQPPPPSKEHKSDDPSSDRSRCTGKSVVSTAIQRQTPTNGFDAKPNKEVVKVVTTGKLGKKKMPIKSNDQAAGEIGGKPQSTSPKNEHQIRLDAEFKTLDTELFPTLDQAAAAGQTKKRRAASIAKSALPATSTAASVSDTVMARNIDASSEMSGLNHMQQSGAKPEQTHSQRSFTTPVAAAVKAPRTKFEQKQPDTLDGDPKQPGDKDNWHTVPPKQKNNGGTNKSHGGRARKYSTYRGTRIARGTRVGATEEQKGG